MQGWTGASVNVSGPRPPSLGSPSNRIAARCPVCFGNAACVVTISNFLPFVLPSALACRMWPASNIADNLATPLYVVLCCCFPLSLLVYTQHHPPGRVDQGYALSVGLSFLFRLHATHEPHDRVHRGYAPWSGWPWRSSRLVWNISKTIQAFPGTQKHGTFQHCTIPAYPCSVSQSVGNMPGGTWTGKSWHTARCQTCGFCTSLTISTCHSKNWNALPITCMTHSRRGLPTLLTHALVAGCKLPGINAQTCKGWSSGDLKALPKSRSCGLRSMSVAEV